MTFCSMGQGLHSIAPGARPRVLHNVNGGLPSKKLPVRSCQEHWNEPQCRAFPTGVSESLGKVFKALECFAEERGLDRSLEIAADLNNIAKASTLSEPVELSPSPNAQTYADYLCRLGLLCTEEDEAAEIEEAALRCGGPPEPYFCAAM